MSSPIHSKYLDESGVADCVRECLRITSELRVRKLSGGVSSLVFICEGEMGERIVLKQSLEFLMVQETWPASRERIFIEIEAMRRLGRILPNGCVPKIYSVNRELYCYAMEAVPEHAVLFKAALLEGEWKDDWFSSCGELLAAMHRETAARPSEFKEAFLSHEHFDSLRLDPYYRFTAAAHPELSRELDRAIDSANSGARCLVHGDFSPKNIFVDPTTDGLILLDYEVAHWGNPAFDVGFFLSHPLAKAIHLKGKARRLTEGIRAFSRAYFGKCGTEGAIEKECLLYWGAIALARVDGKSPLEYLSDDGEKESLRTWGRRLLKGEFSSIENAADRIDAEMKE